MHIIHLEDDGPLREILAVALRAADPTCDLHQFMMSDDALKYLDENGHSVDLFILDIRVPGTVDGLQVAHKIREMNCSGSIVLTSAYRVPEKTLLETLQCEWFPKPWHIIETTSKLLEIVRTRPSLRPSNNQTNTN